MNDLATQADVESALGRFLTESEDVTWVLRTASDRVAAYLGGRPDPVPPEVSAVVADVVVAIITKPAVNTADYNAGGYYQQRETATLQLSPDSVTNTGPWLSKEHKARLRYFRIRGKAFSVNTSGDH